MNIRKLRHVFAMSAAVALFSSSFFGSVSGSQANDKEDGKGKAPPVVAPMALFPFQERGKDVKELGAKVTDLMFAELVTNPDLYLVDRAEITKLLDELQLNLAGLVNPNEATKVGSLTGAKILVTGSVLQVDNDVFLVAKIIGTETSRVLGASVKGKIQDPLDKLVKDLAGEVSKTVMTRADQLLAKPLSREDRLAAMKKKMGKDALPILRIEVRERHVGQFTIDPAAETELTSFAKDLGFEVVDPRDGNRKEADLNITGEGFSEFATRTGNLASVKARLEIKVVERTTGRIVAVDRQTSVAVDLTEQIAGKTALQEAAASIAERIFPKLSVKSDDKSAKGKEKKSKDNE